MRRLFDILLALASAMILAAPVLLVALAVRLLSPGPGMYGLNRVWRRLPAMTMDNNSGER